MPTWPDSKIDWNYRGAGPDQQCTVEVRGNDNHGYWAECTTHYCETDHRSDSEKLARHEFRCDLGRIWRFIVHHTNDDPGPVMVDLTSLPEEIRQHMQNEYAGNGLTPGGYPDLLTLWLYKDGELRALTLGEDQVGQDQFQYTVTDDKTGDVYLDVTLTVE